MKTPLIHPRLVLTMLCVMSADLAIAEEMSDPTGLSMPSSDQTANWNGYYGGFTFGLAQGDARAFRSNGSGEIIEMDITNGLLPREIFDATSSSIAGVTLGYNLERGRFVSGIELDFSVPQFEAEHEFSRVDPGPMFPGVITDTRYRTEFERFATLRLRSGFSKGDTLFYGTAGVAAGLVENEFSLSLPNFPGLTDGYSSPNWSEKETRYGYVVGAGIEHRLTSRVSFKAEAQYYDLSDATVEGRDPASFPGQEIDYSFDNEGFILRLGLNVSF